jgi:membrane-bound lytic murein transglycosylase MltF
MNTTKSRRFFSLLILAPSFLLLLLCPAGADYPDSGKSPPSLNQADERWKGDLKEILQKRRFVRVLVNYSATNFFIDRGRPRGMEYELLKRYEEFLNRQRPKGSVKVKLIYRVMPFDRMLPALLEGRGDIAAAGITITPQRSQKVAFTQPYIRNINEIAVTSKKVKGLKTVQELSGRSVIAVAGSSYVQHLKRLNKELALQGVAPVKINSADKNLEAEDILQMVNAGIYDLTVVDEHVADLWSKVLNNLVIRKNIVINRGGNIAWALRKNSPQLLASLNKFVRSHRQGTLIGNILLKRYFEDTRWVSNPLEESEIKKIEKLRTTFKKYAEQYGFDWLKIAALAYQESRLDQSARSPRGAVGIMQILPSTAAGAQVGIANITKVDNNIHAGVKYLAFLRDRYFNHPEIKPVDRVTFTMAAYNAGPARIIQLRQIAAKEGLDPNRWHQNVEYVSRRVVGRETDQYVANIHMYYIAYLTSEKIIRKREEQTDPKSSTGG